MTREEAIYEIRHVNVMIVSKEARDMAIKALEQDKWIPVSERYPTDTNKCYLVCYEDGCMTIEYLYFDGDGYPFFSEMELGVVAWMPLPEPYKERGQE